MYAKIEFKEPALQYLHKILNILEMEFDIRFMIENRQETQSAEEIVKEIASQLSGDDLKLLKRDLGILLEEK